MDGKYFASAFHSLPPLTAVNWSYGKVITQKAHNSKCCKLVAWIYHLFCLQHPFMRLAVPLASLKHVIREVRDQRMHWKVTGDPPPHVVL